MSDLSRRQFLHDSLLAAAAAATAGAGSSLLAAEANELASSTPKGPNETLRVAVLGVNGRGKNHLRDLGKRGDIEFAIICDADEAVGNKICEDVAKKQSRAPKYVKDMRDVFDDKSIDIVTIALPNHWHTLAAIWAMQAGKDVFLEKPVSHNVNEGHRLIEAVKKYGRVCQVGTQCRSNPANIDAVEFMRSGKIGEVNLARGLCYKQRPSIGARGTYEAPATIDYNLWCGPAPLDPLTRPKLHYDWHWVWPTGNGDLGNQGIHQVDVARWGLGVDALAGGVISYGGRLGYEDAGDTANTQVIVFDYGPKTLVFEVRGLPSKPLKGASVGVIFEGTDGYLVMTTYTSGAAFDKNGEKIQTFAGGNDTLHYNNFVDAVRARKPDAVNAPVHEGHLSSALCHLGNISYRLGSKMSNSEVAERLAAVKMADNAQETLDRTVEHLKENKVDIGGDVQFICGEFLRLDPATEAFIGNDKANAMCTREYRAPFVVPAEGQV